MSKNLLPVINNQNLLPTGKQHVSFSEIHTFLECSFKHKLKYIDNINLDKPSIHTEFGQAIHDTLEEYIKTRAQITEEKIIETKNKFIALCAVLKTEHQIELEQKDIEEFSQSIPKILNYVPEWLDKVFPGWIGIGSEHEIYEAIEAYPDFNFKGFVDAIIGIPAEDDKDKIKQFYIIDWKSSGFGWTNQQKNDFNKQLQLVLYKYYICKSFEINPENVHCGFVILKRQAKDNSVCEFIPVPIGEKVQEKAMNILNGMIGQIKAKRFIKNRNSCRFCPYYNTKYCP